MIVKPRSKSNFVLKNRPFSFATQFSYSLTPKVKSDEEAELRPSSSSSSSSSSPLSKYEIVKEGLTARAWEREAAPETPIKFSLKSKLIKEELASRAWEREAAPESPIPFPLKSKLVKE